MSAELVNSVAFICRHFWCDVHWERSHDGPRMLREHLNRAHLVRHIDGGPPIGLAPIVAGKNTTRAAVLDLDSHKGEVDWPDMVAIGKRLADRLNAHGLRAIPFRSSGGKGIHLILLWNGPQ